MPLEGIPEGIEVVRWGASKPGEWYLHGRGLYYGEFVEALVVRPAAGYEFRFDPVNNRNQVIRQLPAPQNVRAEFQFLTATDSASTLARLETLPGFVRAWEVHEGGNPAPRNLSGFSSPLSMSPDCSTTE